MKRNDLAGQKFGMLTALHFDKSTHGVIYWFCRCDCGTTKLFPGYQLKGGRYYSCGCTPDPSKPPDKKITHGMSKTREYRIWGGMVSRCTDANTPAYQYYGARGITVSDSWRSFENFYRDMGQRPPDGTLERVDNSLGYSVENCEWRGRKDQMRNTRHNVNLTLDGETLCVAAWAEKLGMSAPTLYQRVKLGWSAKRILTTPTSHP